MFLSPTLTASSSSTAVHSQLTPDLPDLAMDKGVDDFSEMFNFDDFENEGASSNALSPHTVSPNHTPSPLPFGQDPITADPAFDYDNMDFTFDYPIQKSPLPGPPDAVEIKSEPMDFDFNFDFAATAAAPTVMEPVLDPAALALPADQQVALQQLMNNIMAYQSQFGELADPAPLTSDPLIQREAMLPQTIAPSKVFSATPPVASSSSISPVVKQSPPIPPPSENPFVPVLEVEEEPLRSIQPSEHDNRSERQESIFSFGGDIDSAIDRLVPLPAIFGAGKGKGGKKGGGMSSVVRGDDEELDDDDAWRPSPEEYKKLSSKEKRQLRNKLSARAFRTRRKDYIGTLEGHIKDRDGLIDVMRSELMNSKTENQDLRRELEALKTSTMKIIHPESAHRSPAPAIFNALQSSFQMPSPVAGPSVPKAVAPVAPVAPAAPAVPVVPKRTSTPVTINTRKDLASASTQAARAFWGGSNTMGGGPTICHTMFTPDLVLPPTSASPFDLPRANLNPRLNDAALPERMPSLASVGNAKDTTASFSEWAEENNFSLRSMDSYRIQIWSRLAREAQADKQGLAGDLRPKFYVENKAQPQPQPHSPEEIATAAHLASLATSHITSQLSQSFWSAFTDSSSSSHRLDTDKLVSVVTGRAKLSVTPVMVEDDLAKALGGLKLRSGAGLDSPRIGVRENPMGALCGFMGMGVIGRA